MAPALTSQCLSIALSVITTGCVAGPFLNEECPRIRRPVDQLSVDDLMLYVEGLQAIRANGKYQVMIDAHHEQTIIHRGSSFFFYHTYYVWEVETQIRALGDKFKCFALPYYDFTVDAGHEHNPSILNSVFGGGGNDDHNNCVGGQWTVDRWPVHELCNADERSERGCCLKRSLWSDTVYKLGTATEVGAIAERAEFKNFSSTEGILWEHQKVHWLFGRGDECAACAMATGYSPDDPIFMLLHSFTAYLRALWAACHGYDALTGHDLDRRWRAYEAFCDDGYDECGVIELDDLYEFGELVDRRWSITSRMGVTPRKMWDFEDWNVRYDPGSFVRRSRLQCSSDLKSSRWLEWGEAAALSADAKETSASHTETERVDVERDGTGGDAECPRIRRPIDEMTTDDLMLFVEGLQAIRANGKYQVIVDAHFAETIVHHGSSSFFYHTYYVWEVETQIRALGAKFDCFSMPFYDFTLDAGHEDDPFVLNSVLGGDGDAEHNDCVGGQWDVDRWPLRELCRDGEDPDIGCCLKRSLWTEMGSNYSLSNASAFAQILEEETFGAFVEGASFEHQAVHWLIGNRDHCTDCAMASSYSPDDPIFLLLHSFMAYLRASWAACHGFDALTGDELDAQPMAYTPFCAPGYDECGPIELDDVFDFGVLADCEWSATSRMDVTPRKMWDFEEWNVRYEPGSFPSRSNPVCSQKVEESRWFEARGVFEHRSEIRMDRAVGARPRGIDEAERVSMGDATKLVALLAMAVLLKGLCLCGGSRARTDGKLGVADKYKYEPLAIRGDPEMYGTI